MPSIYDEPFAYTPFANPADAAVQAMQPLWRAYANAGERALSLWPTPRVRPSVEAAVEAAVAATPLRVSDEPAIPDAIEPEIDSEPSPTEAPAIDPQPAETPDMGPIAEPLQASSISADVPVKPAKRKAKRAAAQTEPSAD